MPLSSEEMRWIIQVLIILVLSICVHEFGHAVVADKLGDRLPRSEGRVTLNPAAHADPIGTLLFPVIGLLFTKGASIGFGWGRPVRVNPVSFSRRFRMRTGHLMVAAAGPGMNIVFGTFIALVHFALFKSGVLAPDHVLHKPLGYAVLLNFVLCFFNLIPAWPLDGGAVLEGLLPDSALPTWEKIKPFGPFILLAVIFIPELAMIFVKPALWMTTNLYDVLGISRLMLWA